MNKNEILKQYSKEEDRLLVAKVLDKIEFSKTRNKITNTDFLDMYQKNIVQKLLNSLKINNYIFYGGFDNAERTSLIVYSDKFSFDIVKSNCNNIMHIIEIILPNELNGKYSHRDYLGGLMKLGIKREKIGDIIVFDEGAHILVLDELCEYLKSNLQELIRFSKSKIQIKDIKNIHVKETRKDELKIIVSSLRLDNIVSELAKTSRTKAEEIVNSGRVFVNFENILKTSKNLKQNDIITIRGKGRFNIKEIVGNTKKGKIIVTIEKYI